MTGEVAKKLVGAWRYVATTIDGVNKPRGNNPKGIIYYGPLAECLCRTGGRLENGPESIGQR